jgi:hypothetical protein
LENKVYDLAALGLTTNVPPTLQAPQTSKVIGVDLGRNDVMASKIHSALGCTSEKGSPRASPGGAPPVVFVLINMAFAS